MKHLVWLVSGLLILLNVACQSPTPTAVAFVPATLPPTILEPTSTQKNTPTATPSYTGTVRVTKTLRPRLQTQTAVKTITPDTATPSPTRPPTNTPLPTPLAHEWDPSVRDILPAPLYLLADHVGKTQIWRFERDAKTKTLITQFGEAIWNFDISPTTGELAFASKHGLFISDAWGGGIRKVELKDESEPIEFTGAVQLYWSPDGTRLLFNHGEPVVYRVSDNSYQRLTYPTTDYSLYYPWTNAWSPNGQYAIIQITFPGDSWGLVVMDVDENRKIASVSIPCGNTSWSLDGQALYAAQSFYSSAYCGGPGLRRQNLNSNKIQELLPARWNADSYFADGAQESSDGHLYYFASSAFVPEDLIQGVKYFPVQMHRAEKNDLSNPSLLRTDSYTLSQVLWSPDFDLAVIVDSEAHGRPDNGRIFILTTDNKPAMELPLRGSNVRWGK